MFRSALKNAKGDSHFVIAAFVDIRDFSSHSWESVQSALFVAKAYDRILSNYFPGACFFKPTGDGLMVIVKYNRHTLQARCKEVVGDAIRLVGDFKSLLADDPEVNFSVPDRIGIGIARGAACRLRARRKTLDYSGRTLNLAARLMDVARPEGVVVDGDFGMDRLPKRLRAAFIEEQAFIRGIAPETPLKVYVLKGTTQIPQANLRPLLGERLREAIETCSLRDWKVRAPRYSVTLPSQPRTSEAATVAAIWPDVSGGKQHPTLKNYLEFPDTFVDFKVIEGQELAVIDVEPIVAYLVDKRVPVSCPVRLRVLYSEA